MDKPLPVAAVGRGSQINPTNRFTRLEVEDDWEHLEHDEEAVEGRRSVRTEYFLDDSRTILSENDSPDIPFRYGLNPYRGCAHGCSYCFARPTHEYLDLRAGLDFETKIFVKLKAAELLRERLSKPDWTGETIMMSGITDCYQPAERRFQVTRQCLEVARDARQPMALVTKNGLVTRDLDVLAEMAHFRTVRVAVSLTSLDQSLTRVMEPRTSSPAARLRAIQELTAAGVPVHVLTGPVIPGLTDSELPSLLKAAADAGATSASYILLRLPLTVEPVFLEWLARAQPSKRDRIESLIRSTREGQLYKGGFGTRMRGTGQLADQIRQTFTVFARKYGLDRSPEPLDGTQFRHPILPSGQKRLFD